MRQKTSTAPLSHQHSAHRRHGPQLSLPCTRETIQPHAPGAAFENALTAMGNNIEQPNSNTGNEAVIPSHTTCCTMGPRVREDDKIKDRKRLIDRSYKEEVGITKMRQDTSTVRLSHKHSVHRRHATSRHSRAHGKPFIHMRRMPRFENALTAIDNTEHPNSNTGSKAVTPNHNTRYTMGPRVREDDKIRDRKRLKDRSYKEEVGITKMRQTHQQRYSQINTQHSATPPVVIPVHTGNHLSTRAGCRV